MMNIWLLFFFIKSAIFDRGFVNDVHTNMKFQCAGSMKEVFTVKSELQCSHRCLYRSCSRLNYKKREEKDNCEVFTKDGECTALSDQGGWKAIIFKVKERQRVQLDITIVSYGKDDPGFLESQAIKINGIDTGPSLRGFNIVVISSTNGYILGTENFDTYAHQNNSAAMISFINKYPDGSIVCIAVSGTGNKLTQEAVHYLAWLGSTGVSSIDFRSSFAMLTAKGVPKPSWFAEKYAARHRGPSIILLSLRF